MKPFEPVLISTDFDGTLILDYDSTALAPKFFSYLNKLRQTRRVIWVINTGREWESLGSMLEKTNPPFFPDWLALVERKIYRVQERELIDLEAWNRRCDAQHAELFQRADPALSRLRRHIEQSNYAEVIADTGSPFGIYAKSLPDAELVAAEATLLLASIPDIMLVRNSQYCRFSHVDFHKGSCLETIANEEGIARENCFAVGDHLNDLHMLNPRYAGRIACPVNSADTVKREVATHGGYVASQPGADGVAEALEHFFGKL